MLAGRDRTVVTGRAGPEYLEVIDPHDWREHKGVVAVLAGIRRRDVIERLAERGNTIMAAEAVRRDACVVEYRRSERRRPMAVVALIAGWQVIDGFADRLIPVVATLAHAEDLDMVDTYDRRPGSREVTALASLGGLDVLCGLRYRTNRTCLVVTARAKRRCSRKHPIHVTAFAGRKLMSAVKAKARRKVIELRGKTRLR